MTNKLYVISGVVVISVVIILIIMSLNETFGRVTYWRFINPKSRNQFRFKGFKGFGLDPVIYTPN